MAWIKSFKNSDGSYDSFDWSIRDVINVKITTIFISVFVISLCSALLPAFILFIYSFSIRTHRVQQGIVGIVACIFWFLDYQLGIFSWGFFHIIPEIYDFITTINIAIFIIIICTLIFDRELIKLTTSTDYGVILSWLGFPLVIFLLYPKASKLLGYLLTMAETSIWST
jgi:hypothetical protein